jgi:hypothetical protein
VALVHLLTHLGELQLALGKMLLEFIIMLAAAVALVQQPAVAVVLAAAHQVALMHPVQQLQELLTRAAAHQALLADQAQVVLELLLFAI